MKNNNINPDETEVTTKDVLEFISASIFFVCLFGAAISTIWCAWKMLQVCLTIIVVELAAWNFLEYIADKIDGK